VFSATTFAGSAQFAAVSVLGAGGSVVAAVLAAGLLNARYAPMSIAAELGHLPVLLDVTVGREHQRLGRQTQPGVVCARSRLATFGTECVA